jgi:DNA-binding NtrC family response regulator
MQAVGLPTKAIDMPTQPDLVTPFEALVVDDEADIREVVGEYLRTRGLKITLAADGPEALGVIARDPTRYRLVITDLQLPGADGLEILRVARDANPSCFVVIVTGYASLDSAIQAVRFGAYDYLTKPFSLGQLDVLLKRLNEHMGLEEENRRLLRQLGLRETADARGPLMPRLEAIETRLARIEALLRDESTRRA